MLISIAKRSTINQSKLKNKIDIIVVFKTSKRKLSVKQIRVKKYINFKQINTKYLTKCIFNKVKTQKQNSFSYVKREENF